MSDDYHLVVFMEIHNRLLFLDFFFSLQELEVVIYVSKCGAIGCTYLCTVISQPVVLLKVSLHRILLTLSS